MQEEVGGGAGSADGRNEPRRSPGPAREPSGRPASVPLSVTLERLGAHTPGQDRYELQGEVARGGMGVIQRVWDGDLGRTVARKLLGREGQGSDSRKSDPRTVGRFLEEAQITAQLEHPGIVPVHELGLDAKGTLYFTMRLVRGEDLHKVFEHVRAGADGWSVTRALGVLLKTCEALAFAHKKGVIHRDLKPANVMVGRFGEVYVMDWGLARVLGEPDTKDVRPRSDPESVEVRTASRREGDTPESPLLTRDGDVIGTPAYMSPEQARGDLAHLDARTDVYALGAMLYHLLSGRVPYSEPGRRLEAHAVLQRVLAGPPQRLAELAPSTPPELLAIAERALARAPEQRYASVSELADDLRAYLELRVVRAYRTGPLVELGKWVRRNRLSAASLAALVLVVAGGGAALGWVQSRRRTAETQRIAELTARSLVVALSELWPVHPERAPDLQRWLEDARALVPHLPAARTALERFEQRHATAPDEAPEDESARGALEAELAFLRVRRDTFARLLAFLREGLRTGCSEQELATESAHPAANRAVLELEVPFLMEECARLARRLDERPRWRTEDPELQREHARLATFVADLEELQRPGDGSIARAEKRLARALGLQVVAEASADEWAQARASIADRERSPHYAELDLEPQVGLVPLRQDPSSGLWEFWHCLSGERPEPAASGAWSVRPETGIVLVLVPGGWIWMGAQDDDPAGPNYFTAEAGLDTELPAVERWLVEVEVAPFFLSKYELTQGQWLRLAGDQPARHRSGNSYLDLPRISRTHPVESISWRRAREVLWRHGLELPSEAQWERAARAGSQTKYATGATFDTLVPFANFADRTYYRLTFAREAGRWDDGFALTAPVDALRPDAWGFHGLFGNVSEWCRDWYASSCEQGHFLPRTGEHLPRYSTEKTCRGGWFESGPQELHASSRFGFSPDSFDHSIGVRPARAIETEP